MKKNVLLIDESLTVQKVVALTLDRARFQVAYAKSRAEAMQRIAQSMPDILLVSDQVADLEPATFPRELETWAGRAKRLPPMLLIASSDAIDGRLYAAVIRKPFAPQTLLQKVAELVQLSDRGPKNAAQPEDFEDQRLQRVFNESFSDEARLVRETLEDNNKPTEAPKASVAPKETPRPRAVAEPAPTREVPPREETPKEAPWLDAGDSVAYKAALERRVEDRLGRDNLEDVVEKVLMRLLPPIVEKLVEERLDRLLKEHEHFLELKQ